MVTAAIYARVSTGAQLENSSPQSQLERCRAYCQSRGYTIAREETEAISGTMVLSRTKFNGLLEMAGDGALDVIAVDIPDRLGRGDAIAKLELLAQLNGARVEYAQAGRDCSTVEGLALKQMDGLVSGMERLNFRRRSIQGKRDLAVSGRVIASPHCQYGYAYVSKRDERGRVIACTLAVVESKAKVVRLMFKWLVDECLTTYRVCERLNSKGIQAPNGGLWTRRTVGMILTCRTYMGEWQWGKSKFQILDTMGKKRSKVVERHRLDAVTVPVPAIISVELFLEAQKQLKKNREKFHGPAKHVYLLGSGRLKCSVCNGTYSGMTTRERWSYYRCRHSLTDTPESDRCGGKVKGPVIETAVWECVRAALLEPDRLFEGIDEMRADKKKARHMLEQALAVTDAQIAKAKTRLDGYADLYACKEIDMQTYRGKKGVVESEISKLEGERADTLKRLGDVRVLSEDEEKELREIAARVAKKLQWGTMEQRSKLFEMLDAIAYYDYNTGDLTVTGLIGERSAKVRDGRTFSTAMTYR